MAIKTVDLGRVAGLSAYEQAKAGGYAGTEAAFNALLASVPNFPTRDEMNASLSNKANALDTLVEIVNINPNNPESCAYATLAEYLQSLHNNGVRAVCGNIGGFPELVNPGWGFGVLAWRGGSGMWQVLVWGVSNHYGLARRELNAANATWVQGSWIPLAECTPPTELALPFSSTITGVPGIKNAYWRTQDNEVRFLCVYQRSGTVDDIKNTEQIFTLPPGYRPSAKVAVSIRIKTATDGEIQGALNIEPDGRCYVLLPIDRKYVSGIVSGSFVAA